MKKVFFTIVAGNELVVSGGLAGGASLNPIVLERRQESGLPQNV